jgi:hypothetical protein
MKGGIRGSSSNQSQPASGPACTVRGNCQAGRPDADGRPRPSVAGLYQSSRSAATELQGRLPKLRGQDDPRAEHWGVPVVQRFCLRPILPALTYPEGPGEHRELRPRAVLCQRCVRSEVSGAQKDMSCRRADRGRTREVIGFMGRHIWPDIPGMKEPASSTAQPGSRGSRSLTTLRLRPRLVNQVLRFESGLISGCPRRMITILVIHCSQH